MSNTDPIEAADGPGYEDEEEQFVMLAEDGLAHLWVSLVRTPSVDEESQDFFKRQIFIVAACGEREARSRLCARLAYPGVEIGTPRQMADDVALVYGPGKDELFDPAIFEAELP